jgi:hypothetical protein
MQNKEIRFVSRPTGMPTRDNFQIVESDVPKPGEGEVLLRTNYISVDPYLRGRMREGRSYVPPFQLGDVLVSGALAEVVESRSPKLQRGDLVAGDILPWQLYTVAPAEALHKIDPALAPPTIALGVLGMPGLTAYFGLLEIGKPKEGETVVVSGAAGAVGGVVCQIAKIKGCRVIGITGSEEKNRYLLDELGIAAALSYKNASGYKTASELRRELQELCPRGVDVYFDNVGGDVSDAVIPLIAKGARIPICGQIALYNLDAPDVGPRPQPYLLVNSALMQGFIITQFAPRFAEGIAQLSRWVAEGKLKYTESIVEGFENTPEAFIGLFTGENLGKQLVKVS